MIMAGKNVTAKDDPLQKIKVEYLYHKLIHPDTEIESKIRQLRIVQQLDPKHYSTLKRQLPYVVCGMFNPPFRRTENFAYTEYFMVDIDHIAAKELHPEALKDKLKTDPRIVLCFVSPGQDGLKILFKLKERCYDAGVYSVFYKLFVAEFAQKYALEQVIDARTSDVARACFVSTDSDAYYNEQAAVVDMNNYLNSENSDELFRLRKQAEAKLPASPSGKTPEQPDGPDDEALKFIRSLLNPGGRNTKPKLDAYVPEELNLLMERLVPLIEQSGVKVIGIDNINFAKKIKLMLAEKQSEINVFHGKRGYSVVISPRRGTDNELNKLMATLIEQYIYEV